MMRAFASFVALYLLFFGALAQKGIPVETTLADGTELITKPAGASDGQSFVLKESQKTDAQKTSHEMGHNLGMEHSKGLMKTTGGKNLHPPVNFNDGRLIKNKNWDERKFNK